MLQSHYTNNYSCAILHGKRIKLNQKNDILPPVTALFNFTLIPALYYALPVFLVNSCYVYLFCDNPLKCVIIHEQFVKCVN